MIANAELSAGPEIRTLGLFLFSLRKHEVQLGVVCIVSYFLKTDPKERRQNDNEIGPETESYDSRDGNRRRTYSINSDRG